MSAGCRLWCSIQDMQLCCSKAVEGTVRPQGMAHPWNPAHQPRAHQKIPNTMYQPNTWPRSHLFSMYSLVEVLFVARQHITESVWSYPLCRETNVLFSCNQENQVCKRTFQTTRGMWLGLLVTASLTVRWAVSRKDISYCPVSALEGHLSIGSLCFPPYIIILQLLGDENMAPGKEKPQPNKEHWSKEAFALEQRAQTFWVKWYES